MVIEVLLREDRGGAVAKAASGGERAMTKITTEHLARSACVYIRQSTGRPGSRIIMRADGRQYGLVDRAKPALAGANVEVIDDDLGRLRWRHIAPSRLRAAARNDLRRARIGAVARDRGVASCPQWAATWPYADRVSVDWSATLIVGPGRKSTILAIPTIGLLLGNGRAR